MYNIMVIGHSNNRILFMSKKVNSYTNERFINKKSIKYAYYFTINTKICKKNKI